MSKAELKQLGWAAVGVVAGMALYNTVRTIAGSTIVGRVLDGSLVRRA